MSQRYQLFDPLPAHVESALRASIQRFGVLVPVVTDQHGNVIDGHHRGRIADELGVKYRVDLVQVANGDEAREIAHTLNADRRHLTEEQRREVAAHLRGQGHSLRAIAAAVGSSKSTVERDLSTVPPGTIPERVTGLDGKSRPATRPLIVTAKNTREAGRAQEALAGLAAAADAVAGGTDTNARRAAAARKGGLLNAREAAKASLDATRAVKGYEWQQRQAERVRRLADENPELTRYVEAVNRGEITIETVYRSGRWTGWGNEIDGPNVDVSLLLKDVSVAYDWQTWHWPRYSGVHTQRLPTDDAAFAVPTFTADEWETVRAFDEQQALDGLDFPGSECFIWTMVGALGARLRKRFGCPTIRREYNPLYGADIVEHPDDTECDHAHGRAKALFVRQGWGEWWMAEFNDGNGGRERRRYFRHDHACPSFVEHAYKVVDPLTFASENLRDLQRDVYQAMPVEMSWAYIRHRTIDRAAAVTALESALDRLRTAQPLTPDEIHVRAAEWLQDYTPAEVLGGGEWRQGVCTEPRRHDGTVDRDEWERLASPSTAGGGP